MVESKIEQDITRYFKSISQVILGIGKKINYKSSFNVWINKDGCQIETDKKSFVHLEEKSIKNKGFHSLDFANENICRSEIIISKKKLKLIGFGGISLIKQSVEKEIKNGYLNLFLIKYIKPMRDFDLERRIKDQTSLNNFSDLLLAMDRFFKAINRRLHKDYLKNKSLKENIIYIEKICRRYVLEKIITIRFINFERSYCFK